MFFAKESKVKRVDKTVLRESAYIGAWAVVLSVIMQSVFLIINKWDLTVLAANALSLVLSVGNFFFMAYTVQLALAKPEKEAKNTVKLSQSLRMLVLFACVCVGAYLPCFNVVALLIPLIFPRIAIAFRQVFDKSLSEGGEANDGEEGDTEEE